MFETLLQSHARQQHDSVALRILENGRYREWTYGRAWALARSVAAALGAQGVGPGDRVALFADNSPEWVLAFLGICCAHAVAVPLDTQFADRELRNILEFARCKLILASDAKRPLVEPLGIPLLVLERNSPLFNAAPIENVEPRNPDDLMIVLFTSGTTGEPKGVCLSVGNLDANLQAILTLKLVNHDDTLLGILPLHHCYALMTSILAPLAVGGSVTLSNSLRGPDILAAIRDTGVSVVVGVPKLFEGFDRSLTDRIDRLPGLKRRLARSLLRFSHVCRTRTGRNVGRWLFPSLRQTFGPRFRFFVSGGAKLDPAIAERFLDLGIPIVEGYGLTEASPVVAFNPPGRVRPGAVGLPLPGVKIRIEPTDHQSVGQILVQGPNVMVGYDRRPDLTAEILSNGWLHTGDLGYLDPDGYLRITGRAKEVIVLGSGKNIYPEDVEQHYLQSPLIRELCIMPVELPDGRVERLCAVVVPNFEEIQRIKATGIFDAVRQEVTKLSQALPSYMRVTDLKIVTNELPRTRLGKLRRTQIRHMAFEEIHHDCSILSPNDQALMDLPLAGRLIDRVRAISRSKEPIVPAHNLELDLGLDSLGRIELAVALEQEFGVTIPPEQSLEIHTVGDLLRRLSRESIEEVPPAGWDAILSQTVAPPLARSFNLRASFVKRTVLNLLRSTAYGFSAWTFPFDVSGLEHLPSKGPYLLCPTHASFIDSVLVYIALPDRQIDQIFFLGAAEFFESRLMRWVAKTGRIIPTATSDTVLDSLRRAAEVIRLGYSLCIFPEGHITRDGFLQRPRPGAGILACQLHVPIVPVLVRGTYELLSYTHPGFRFRPVGLTFGPPIAPLEKSAFDNADYADLMNQWRQAVIGLRIQDDIAGGRTAGKSPRLSREIPNGDNS